MLLLQLRHVLFTTCLTNVCRDGCTLMMLSSMRLRGVRGGGHVSYSAAEQAAAFQNSPFTEGTSRRVPPFFDSKTVLPNTSACRLQVALRQAFMPLPIRWLPHGLSYCINLGYVAALFINLAGCLW